ncbi:hypothetical protein Cni_G22571 [Canna indica]|uniref:Uncharacterized protein n=1 Tax=Canna indica TaxID=4628 RepID=A0AAQ3KUD5_9LILI|nr:hypothetical protein Cni_G22571 [Canna indica]
MHESGQRENGDRRRESPSPAVREWWNAGVGIGEHRENGDRSRCRRRMGEMERIRILCLTAYWNTSIPLSESARTVGAGPTVPVVQAGRMLKSSNLQSQTSRSIIGLYSVQGLEKMTADAINITRET